MRLKQCVCVCCAVRGAHIESTALSPSTAFFFLSNIISPYSTLYCTTSID